MRAGDLANLACAPVLEILGCSLKTTNCLQSVNALIEERCAKVDCWKKSNQRQRTALLDILNQD